MTLLINMMTNQQLLNNYMRAFSSVNYNYSVPINNSIRAHISKLYGNTRTKNNIENISKRIIKAFNKMSENNNNRYVSEKK